MLPAARVKDVRPLPALEHQQLAAVAEHGVVLGEVQEQMLTRCGLGLIMGHGHTGILPASIVCGKGRTRTMTDALAPTTEALLIIDVQNDFLPGGALAVPDGDQVIAPINALAADPRFGVVIATRDWHPPDHDSFVDQGGPVAGPLRAGHPRRLVVRPRWIRTRSTW